MDFPDDLEIEKTSVGIDWLTITSNDDSRKQMIFRRFQLHQEALKLMGESPKPWAFHGYAGLSIGSIRWGTREDSDILILSGQDAQALWRVYAPLSTNCSRVDLAVTVKTTKCYPRLIHTYIDWIRENSDRTTKKAVNVERVDGIGQTLYIGSRDSDQFGRLYDKGAQMKSPLDIHRLWRYEVEFKRERSYKVLWQLLSPDVGDKFPQNICSTVYDWFNKRDVPPFFEKRGQSLALDLSATVTSTSQKLAWLSKGVRPTVERLVQAGYEEEVFAALGL